MAMSKRGMSSLPGYWCVQLSRLGKIYGYVFYFCLNLDRLSYIAAEEMCVSIYPKAT
jgi:hypothetical protein